MRKLTVILIGLLTCTFITGQTYSSEISDKEIYDFLNWLTVSSKKYSEEPKLKRKQIRHKILNWDKEVFFTDTIQVRNQPIIADWDCLYQTRYGTDTIFNQQDRDFIYQQFAAIRDSIWHNGFSKSKLLTNQKQKRTNIHYYSIPLFSFDKSYVIVNRKYCCGDECAYGGFYVYKRIGNKKWKFVTVVNPWMS